MKKRLVRKTFDMIEDIANRENKEVNWRKLSLSFSKPIVYIVVFSHSCSQLIRSVQVVLNIQFWSNEEGRWVELWPKDGYLKFKVISIF